MTGARVLAMSIASLVISSSVTVAQDLSRYREFHLGMSVNAVAQQAGITPDAGLIDQRPGLTQELVWQPPRGVSSSPPGDSLRKVVFGFYNGELFRIVVNYDWDKTEGLTVDDMIDALSVMYGPATLPATEINASLLRVATESDGIVAHWGDPQYSVNLFRPFHASTFGLVVFSKRLDALARAASVDTIRRDEQDAPRRAIDRRQKQEDEDHARQEKVRQVNKATFRP